MRKLTTNEEQTIQEALNKIREYQLLDAGTPQNIIQEYRDAFAEHKRLIGVIQATWEHAWHKVEHERRVEAAHRYKHYKLNGDGVNKMTENQINSQVIIDTEDLKNQELNTKDTFRRIANLYTALGDFQNSCASRMKIEE